MSPAAGTLRVNRLRTGFAAFAASKPIQIALPTPERRQRLDLAPIGELHRTRAQHLAHRVARDVQLPDELLDRLAPHEEFAPDPRNCVHALHPPTVCFKTRAGSPLGD